ncbi:MAG: hypothetical protein ACKO96_14365, partial [Flammeovirgaceae bacterium]
PRSGSFTDAPPPSTSKRSLSRVWGNFPPYWGNVSLVCPIPGKRFPTTGKRLFAGTLGNAAKLPDRGVPENHP